MKRVRITRQHKWQDGNAKKVDNTTPWGNDAANWKEVGRAEAVRLFYQKYHNDKEYRKAVREHLRGYDLACWCPLDEPCHADCLMKWANE